MKIKPIAVPLAVASGLAVAACGADSASGSDTTSIEIVAGFYPLAFATEQVSGGDATVVNLTATGADAHDAELTARQIGQVVDADLVVHLAGFQPAVDDAAEQTAGRTLDVATVIDLHDEDEDEHDHEDGHEDDHEDDHDNENGHEDEHDDENGHADDHAHSHEHDLDGDPHFWLDPANMASLGEAIADELADIDPGNADAYHERAHEFAAELAALDDEYATGLANCERTTFVTSHAAFGYLAEKYGLEMVGVAGIDPEIEPSPARMAEVQEIVRADGVTTIFYERLVSPAVAESIAGDLDVATDVLDPIESLTDDTAGEDYLSLMRANLDALKEANGCA